MTGRTMAFGPPAVAYKLRGLMIISVLATLTHRAVRSRSFLISALVGAAVVGGGAQANGSGGSSQPVATVAEVGVADAGQAEQFRALFQSWKKMDTTEGTAIAIPSTQPVDALQFTSNFGVRSDPFRGTAAMHSGVDIPGPIGTPIYATADGIVARAERAGGYGNLIEVNHGRGIETRYGHLSKILVEPNTRVRRGQLIGLMGSTGRSTGSHLHYEVRVEGHAVNPVPYLQVADMGVAIQDRALKVRQVAVGGPVDER